MSRINRTQAKYILDVAQGLTAQESADRHRVSVHTVYSVHKRVKRLLGARTIAHAAILSLIEGDFTAEQVREES